MKVSKMAAAACGMALGLAALTSSAARFGDENDVSWLPMSAMQKEKMQKMATGSKGHFCLTATRMGDESDLSWLMRAAPCKDGEPMAKMPVNYTLSRGMVRFQDENDLSWLPMSSMQQQKMKSMTASRKGMCASTTRWGDENDLSWVVKMVDC